MSRSAPLRILYSFPHRVGAPGIGTTALNQVRALAELGVDVTLVCTSLQAEVPDSVRVGETLKLAGRRVPHRAFGTADRALGYHDWRVARHLRRSPGQFDVVHTWPQSCLATFKESRRQGVLSSREVPNTHTANAFAEASKEASLVGVEIARRHSHRPHKRHLRLEEQEYVEADLLMVPSAHVEETFLARGFSTDQLRRHQYGYDASRYSASNRSEIPSRPFTAVFVGSAEPRKGLHYALEAWTKAHPEESRLLIAGGFVEGYRETLIRQLNEPGVEVLGFVNDVPNLLRDCDVLLLPSIEEGSALVTYEAQASGCIPLVSSAAGALLPLDARDYVVHRPRDVASLTQQLRRIASDDDLRHRLRDEIIEWSRSLTWTDAGRRMVEIYEDALSSRFG